MLHLDSANEVEQWYVRHNYFIVLLHRQHVSTYIQSLISGAKKHAYHNPKGNKARHTLRTQGIAKAPNMTKDHHKVALHRSINRSQHHKYGLLDFYLIQPA